MRSPHEDEVFGKVNRLMHLTRDEDERGLALSVAAFAEDCLGRLIGAYLRDGSQSKDLIEGFNAPLGTLSSRIKAGFALGLLTEDQYRDLELARKIRNEFAHKWEGCTFEQQNIKDWIAAMTHSRIAAQAATSSREKFYSSMTCVLVELEALLGDLGRRTRKIPVVAFHLSRTPPS